MPISFEKIGQYLHYLSEVHGVQFCIKDFCGFVAINKQLDETLRPFLAHTNPFCMYMKSDQEHYHTCLTMIRRLCRACRQEPPLDPDTAQRLYRSAIRTPTANVEQMLAGLELLAEYLGQTYHLLHSAQPHSDAAGR